MAVAEQAKVVARGEGRTFSMVGIELTPKVRSSDLGGALSIIEEVVAPGAGSPPHICHRDDKVLYILEGEFEVLLGEKTVRASAGACAVIPKGTIHNFRNAGTSAGRLIAILTPGGHEEFLEDLSKTVTGGKPDPAAMASVCSTHGVEMVGPR